MAANLKKKNHTALCDILKRNEAKYWGGTQNFGSYCRYAELQVYACLPSCLLPYLLVHALVPQGFNPFSNCMYASNRRPAEDESNHVLFKGCITYSEFC